MGLIERVLLAPGDGTVAREGSTVLLAGGAVSEDGGIVDEVLEWVHSGREGASLVRQVGGLVAGAEPARVPPLALLTLTPAGAALFLCGAVEALVVGEGTTTHLSGADAVTFVDRVVADPEQVRLALPDAPEPDGSVTVGDGRTCQGVGCRVDLVPTPSGPSSDQTSGSWVDPNPTMTTQVVPAVGIDRARLSETAPGSYLSLRTTRHAEETEVMGVRCPHGHFTRPRAARCLHCGAPVDPDAEPFPGARPPLGLLTTDHGEQRVVEHDLVIGRDPSSAEEVQSGGADPLPLTDPQLATSRVHSRLILDGWDVLVEDEHSANGTFISEIEGEWERLVPGEPRLITSGTQIAVGSRILRFSAPYDYA